MRTLVLSVRPLTPLLLVTFDPDSTTLISLGFPQACRRTELIQSVEENVLVDILIYSRKHPLEAKLAINMNKYHEQPTNLLGLDDDI